jgi:hypothetical protein
VKNHLTVRFEEIGMVKPSAGAVILMKSAVNAIVNLIKSDTVVFCGGSNNVRTIPI